MRVIDKLMKIILYIILFNKIGFNKIDEVLLFDEYKNRMEIMLSNNETVILNGKKYKTDNTIMKYVISKFNITKSIDKYRENYLNKTLEDLNDVQLECRYINGKLRLFPKNKYEDSYIYANYARFVENILYHGDIIRAFSDKFSNAYGMAFKTALSIITSDTRLLMKEYNNNSDKSLVEQYMIKSGVYDID